MNFAKANVAASGNLSGMAAALSNSHYAGAYGSVTVPDNVLQSINRQGMELAGTPFSPSKPINPRREMGTSPLQWAYMIGQNIVQLPRSNEAVQYSTIDGIFAGYDVAKLARKVRLDQARTMDWHIVPNDPADYKKYKSDIDKVTAFFDKPYSGALFSDFMVRLEHDRISYDALAIYKRRNKGGKLVALEPVDGRTITPVIDFYGHSPLPPAPGYVQYIRGYPEVWMTRDALIYRPFYLRNGSTYGTPPLETVMLNANTDERFLLSALQYFTQGDVPDTFINLPADMDMDALKKWWKDYEDVLKGIQEYKHMIFPLPAGAKAQQMREYTFNEDEAMHLLTITCGAFDVVPSEIGFTQNISKSSGDSQENVQERRSYKPTIKFYNEIFTDIIHTEFNMPYLHFELALSKKDEDQLEDAQRHQILVNVGIESREDAALALTGHAPIDGIDSGRTVMLSNQIVKIDDVANGVMGQGEVAGAAPQTQKTAKDSLKKNEITFQNKKEESLVSPFAAKVANVLKREAIACGDMIKLQYKKLHKDDSGMLIIIAAVLSMIDEDGFDDAMKAALWDEITNVYEESAKESGIEIPPQTNEAGEEMTADEIFHNGAEQYAGQHIGDMITGLDETTKDLVKSSLENAIKEGMTPADIADMLNDNYAFSDSRAATIARSETADAWNSGSLDIGVMAGHNAAKVVDGDSDPECAEANGQIWSIGYAKNHLKQHPNCIRSFSVMHAEPDEIDRDETYE